MSMPGPNQVPDNALEIVMWKMIAGAVLGV